MVRHRARWSLLCCLVAFGAACGNAETATTDPPAGTPQCPPIEEDFTAAPAEVPDGPAACAPGVCNYQTQEGCSEDAACRPQFNAIDPEVQPGCEPASAGAATAGGDCQAQSDCARGYYCAEGACRKLCCGGDWTGCAVGESCLRSLQVKAGGQIVPAGVELCFPVGTCDPLDPRSCADEPGRECKIVDPTGAVACAPQSSARLGDACAPPDVCQQGLACVGGRCIKLCAYAACGEPACAPEEGTCVHFARDPAGVGECTADR